MDIGIIGSGRVAQTLAAKLLELGNRVTVSSRDTTRGEGPRDVGHLPSADAFAAAQRELGRDAAAGSFADAAAAGEVVINATAGGHSLEALAAAGADHLAGKILVDVANPLDFSRGMPPTLLFCNTESLGERIQAAFPEARVVKALNTTNAQVMVDPRQLTEPSDDLRGRQRPGGQGLGPRGAAGTLVRVGAGARPGRHHGGPGPRDVDALWLRLMGATGTAAFNLRSWRRPDPEPAERQRERRARAARRRAKRSARARS